MKKRILIVSILVLCVFIWSCDNEPYEGELFFPVSNENPTIPEDFENAFYAKLNGLEFLDQNIYTTVSEGPGDHEFIAITGSENNYHSIILYLPSNISVGTYYYDTETIVTVPNLNVTYSNLADLNQSGIGVGSVSIIEHDLANHYIKGNFECVVNAQNGSIHYITEGSFEIVY